MCSPQTPPLRPAKGKHWHCVAFENITKTSGGLRQRECKRERERKRERKEERAIKRERERVREKERERESRRNRRGRESGRLKRER